MEELNMGQPTNILELNRSGIGLARGKKGTVVFLSLLVAGIVNVNVVIR